MTISFQVHGLPKGQPRARAFAQRFGNKYSARMYDPGTADEWKEQVYLALKRELDRLQVTPTLGAVRMTLTFSMPRPKAHYGKRGLKEKAPREPVGKPDIDNLTKLVLDVVTKDGRVWRDDSQVTTMIACKGYVVEGQRPGVWVSIATHGDPLDVARKDLRDQPPEV
jgi:Holliday junction resolvase RusA-like endonuclease